MGSGSQGCPRLGEEGQGAIHQGPGPHLYHSDSQVRAQMQLLLAPGRGSSKPGGLLGQGALTCGDSSSYQTDDPATCRRGVYASCDMLCLASKEYYPSQPLRLFTWCQALGQTFQMHEWSSQPCWVGGVNIPVLQTRKSKLRKGKESHSRLLEKPAWGQRTYGLKLYQLES